MRRMLRPVEWLRGKSKAGRARPQLFRALSETVVFRGDGFPGRLGRHTRPLANNEHSLTEREATDSMAPDAPVYPLAISARYAISHRHSPSVIDPPPRCALDVSANTRRSIIGGHTLGASSARHSCGRRHVLVRAVEAPGECAEEHTVGVPSTAR